MFQKFPLFAKIGSISFTLLCFLGIVSYFSFEQAEALQEAEDARTLESLLLQMSREQQQFLLRRDNNHALRYDSLYSSFRTVLLNLRQDDVTDNTTSLIEMHKFNFSALQVSIQERGLSEKEGIEGEFRAMVHTIETLLQEVKRADLEVQMLQARRSEKDYLMRKDPKYIARVEEKMEMLKSIASTASLPASVKDSVVSLSSSYVDAFHKVVAVFSRIDSLQQANEQVEQVSLANLAELVSAKRESATTEQRFMVAVISFSILCGLIFSILVVRNILTPIHSLRAAANAMGRGESDIRIQTRSNDEIGELAVDFNTMAENIEASQRAVSRQQHSLLEQQKLLEEGKAAAEQQKQYLHESITIILKEMREFAAGNLTVEVPEGRAGEIGLLFGGFNESVERIRKALAEIAKVVNSTDDISRQLHNSTESLVAISREQWERSEAINHSLSEMSSAISASSKLSAETATFALSNEQEAQKASTVVSASIMQIKNVVELVQEATSKIAALGNKSSHLGEIVGTIDAIAKQTNLLALNAAIEAARAGEHGRGFAIVAEKVSELSSQTAEATRSISEMLKEISNDIEEIVNSMQEGSRQVSDTAHLADSAGIAMQHLMLTADAVKDKLVSISSAIDEQAAVSESILEAVKNLAHISSSASNATDDIAIKATDLAATANQLAGLTDHFQIYKTQQSSPKRLQQAL